MCEPTLKGLIDRYIAVSFSVTTLAGSMVKEQIDSEMTSDQFYTMRHIHQSHSCTSTQLAEVFKVKKSAITAIINRMWDKGLIKRTRDENDRRIVYLTLTERGKKLYFISEKRIYHLVELFISQFDETEIKQFIQTYEKLNSILQEIKEDKVEKRS